VRFKIIAYITFSLRINEVVVVTGCALFVTGAILTKGNEIGARITQVITLTGILSKSFRAGITSSTVGAVIAVTYTR
jgi:hypothetical protein